MNTKKLNMNSGLVNSNAAGISGLPPTAIQGATTSSSTIIGAGGNGISTASFPSSSSSSNKFGSLSLSQLSQQTANMPIYNFKQQQQQQQGGSLQSSTGSSSSTTSTGSTYNQHQQFMRRSGDVSSFNSGGGSGGSTPSHSFNSPNGSAKSYTKPVVLPSTPTKQRYSKEELLTLFNPNAKVPETLISHTHILSEEIQTPVNNSYNSTYDPHKRMNRLNNSSGGINNQRVRESPNGVNKQNKWNSGSNSSHWRKEGEGEGRQGRHYQHGGLHSSGSHPNRSQTQWFYLDPQNVTQGPFPSSGMDDWHKAGYFTPTLKIKRGEEGTFFELKKLVALVGNDSPFSLSFNVSDADITDLDRPSDDLLGSSGGEALEDELEKDENDLDPDSFEHIEKDDTDEVEDEKILHGLDSGKKLDSIMASALLKPNQALQQQALLTPQQTQQQQDPIFNQQQQPQPQQPLEQTKPISSFFPQLQSPPQQPPQPQPGQPMSQESLEMYQKYMANQFNNGKLMMQKLELQIKQLVDQLQVAEAQIKQYYQSNQLQQGQPVPVQIQQLQNFYLYNQQQQRILMQQYTQLKFMHHQQQFQFNQFQQDPNLLQQQLYQQQMMMQQFQMQQMNQQQQPQQPLPPQQPEEELKSIVEPPQQPQQVVTNNNISIEVQPLSPNHSGKSSNKNNKIQSPQDEIVHTSPQQQTSPIMVPQQKQAQPLQLHTQPLQAPIVEEEQQEPVSNVEKQTSPSLETVTTSFANLANPWSNVEQSKPEQPKRSMQDIQKEAKIEQKKREKELEEQKIQQQKAAIQQQQQQNALLKWVQNGQTSWGNPNANNSEPQQSLKEIQEEQMILNKKEEKNNSTASVLSGKSVPSMQDVMREQVREERVKQQQQQQQQQQQLEQQQQQQQQSMLNNINPSSPWGSNNQNNNEKKVNIANIIQQEQKPALSMKTNNVNQTFPQLSIKTQSNTSSSSSTPAPATTTIHTSDDSFWDSSSPSYSNAKLSILPSNKPGPKSSANKKSQPQQQQPQKTDFMKWCHTQLKPLTAQNGMDVETVTELLCSLKKETEIRECAKEMLGFSSDVTNFINDYLMARSDEPGLSFEPSTTFITVPMKKQPSSKSKKRN